VRETNKSINGFAADASGESETVIVWVSFGWPLSLLSLALAAVVTRCCRPYEPPEVSLLSTELSVDGFAPLVHRDRYDSGCDSTAKHLT
jgi:hypothetical protein